MSTPIQPVSEQSNEAMTSRLNAPGEAAGPMPAGARPKVQVRNLDFFYGSYQALKEINLEIQENHVTAFIGPSGCGKSTFLRTLDRMHELVRKTRVEGAILLDGVN